MKKTLRLFGLFATVVMLSLSLTSCGDDDDEPESTIDDFYSECVSVTGGGWTPQECSQFQNTLNTDDTLELGPQYVWRNMDKSQAIYYFDRQMNTLKSIFSDGMSGISGTLKVSFVLKGSKGNTIKTSTLSITSTSCSLS